MADENVQEKISPEARFVLAARALIPAGTKTLMVRYSGSGDSGQVDEIDLNGRYSPELTELPWQHEFNQALEPLIWVDVSPNNEGGGGELEIDFEAGVLTRSEYYNVEHTEHVGEQVYKDGKWS